MDWCQEEATEKNHRSNFTFCARTTVHISIINDRISKKVLTKGDYIGHYTIDRDFFPGKQANWQYDHFRFEITEDHRFLFHVTNKEKIIKTYQGKVYYPTPYSSARIDIKLDGEAHHVIMSNPTTYRST